MPKNPRMLTKGINFHLFDHLYAMNDESKTTLMCGIANCNRSSCSSCVILVHTNEIDLIQLTVPHTHVVFLLYQLQGIIINTQKEYTPVNYV